jgi:chromosome segregation ATPase
VVEQRSLPALLAELERQADELRRKVAHHTSQEEHHREQKQLPTERLQTLDERLLRFRESAEAVLAVAETPKSNAPSAVEDWGSAYRPKLGRMVEHVVGDRFDPTPFGAEDISREVNRLFAQHLRRATDGRQISVVLRRLRDQGRLRLARAGRAYREALYARVE